MAFTDKVWVLVIEDIPDQAELWSDICAQASLNAMTATTGVKGYQRAADLQQRLRMRSIILWSH